MAEKKEKRYVSDNAQLMAEWDWEKNTENSPDALTLGSGKKVWWKCNIGHSWSATIDKRSSGKGCPYCAGRLVSEINRLSIIRPDIAATWDYEKNYPITPDDISFSSNKKYWWKCYNNHSWLASCNSRSNGNGCPYCSGRIATVERSLKSEMPNLCAEWDYDKNGDLLPEQFNKFSTKKVWWKCSNGHSYLKSIAKKSLGDGCPICSNRQVVSGVNDLVTTHPYIAVEWNYEKNGSLTPEQIHAGSSKKVWWKCEKGHQWESSIVNRTRNRNCPYCFGKIATPERNLAIYSTSLINEWDYEKNIGIKPEEFTPHSNKKVWWKCEFGHNWLASINKRVEGSKCPVCWREMRTSFPEQCVLFYLKKYFKHVSNGYRLCYNKDIIEFDVFIHDINVAIEYDGEYFHKEKLKSDQKKNEIAKQSGITLYRMRENGCPEINGCNVILLEANYTKNDFASLEKAILILIKKILHIDAHICINDDKNEIFQQYVSFRKKHSVAVVCPTLAEEWNYEKNGSLSPFNVTYGTAKIVWWKCKKCGFEYEVSVNKRKQGSGCPACAGKIAVCGLNDLLTKYPSVAEDWDYHKNKLLKPENVLPKSHKKVWWKCKKCGYEWEQSIANRTRAIRCPNCKNKS